MLEKFKEFKPSSWAIDNKVSIYILTVIICIVGVMSYNSLPKESFPDITVPTIFVSTVNAGNSPTNIENTITKPIEKKLKSVSGIKKVTSTSLQDVSVIVVEFNTNVNTDKAKLKVKDAVDEARTDMPQTLTMEPRIKEIAFSEIPIMYINVAGKYDLKKLKKYAEDLQEKIEGLKEINEAKLVGALDREIQVNLDMYKMQAAQLTLGDVQRAISAENLSITLGQVPMDGMKRTLSIKKEFKDIEEIKNMVINSQSGARMYLKDIAEVNDSFLEQESFSSSKGKNVITLNVIKRPGENLIEASQKIKNIIEDMKEEEFPEGLEVTISGDQSDKTEVTLHDLINTIIIGFVLVTFILMFFMGVTNALFVASSVPLSMFIAFMIMPAIGFSMNMIVLFAFLLALGIVVDDAIVVIENTHRIFDNGKRDIKTAAKMAAGEVFLPVLSGTLTTLAPFIPLAFWSGIIGKFMFFLPVTLIITLMASLLVAYIINPVFAVDFMKPHHEEKKEYGRLSKKAWRLLILYAIVALLAHLGGKTLIGNLVIFLGLFMVIHRLFLYKVIEAWQTKAWPAFQNKYTKFLKWNLVKPWRPIVLTVVAFVFTMFLFVARSPKVVFFPEGDPNNIFVYVKLPVGTDPVYTNTIMRDVEKKVDEVLGKNNPIVESIITNVTVGVTDPQDQDQNKYPNRGKIAINFVRFGLRTGESTGDYLQKLQNLNWNIAGAEISVNKEQAGPPTSKPINIEIVGDKLEDLLVNANNLKRYLDEQKIPGIVELKKDLEDNKPEIIFDIDRERANREGISTGQLAMEIRGAVFGTEATKFRDADDEYPVQLRYKYDQRINIETIRNLKVTFRDMNLGGILRSVPLSSVCNVYYSNTYGGIKRKNYERVITLSSDVKADFNPNEVVAKVQKAAVGYKALGDVEVKFTGQQEEQQETGAFLGRALLISFGLMLLILVLQFNSFGKPIIIMSEILFSVIGVLLGTAIFKMDMSIVMTGVGVIALGGIAVRNGILLIEYAELKRKEGMKLWDATLEAGRTRMTPVLLTATAAILGLIPLAVGLNIDFEALFTEFNPHIYFGGDNVTFWGPLSWTMIFGLAFATVITLIIVPAMYLMSERLKKRSVIILKHYEMGAALMYVPFLISILRAILWFKKIKLDYGDLNA
ncbi:MAG: efflux RND transporter permease subunit [Bacteroidota bacterium]|nr:efflux RND transporter permease subunit [Bacteroidota bacterium]